MLAPHPRYVRKVGDRVEVACAWLGVRRCRVYERIVTGASGQLIGTVTASQLVLVGSAEELIVACAPNKDILISRTIERVVSAASNEGIVAWSARNRIADSG